MQEEMADELLNSEESPAGAVPSRRRCARASSSRAPWAPPVIDWAV